MNFMTMLAIEEQIKKYTEAYGIGNDIKTLNVCLQTHLCEEDKELFLTDLDRILPYDLIFSHEYQNGKLKVIFKEVQ